MYADYGGLRMNFDKIIAVRTGKTVYKDGGRAVKVFDGDYSKSDILNEALNQARAEEAGLNVPSLISVDGENGRWSITSSYINGKTAARIITETPERTALALEALVNAQLLFQSYKLPLLTALKSKAARRIAAAEISDKKRKELSGLLDTLPDGDSLCHCDFTPSNVVITDGGEAYVLDWSHASRGDAAADAAATYLRIKFESEEGAQSYLSLYCEKSGKRLCDIEKWIPVVAAAISVGKSAAERNFLLSNI
ncbi:MAG TPA: aminoglycoside phosphotransferase [Ruminococcaceae bacterium]|nr:aminoglycoside phosphotransferase [Oscillospiraceae bacterium]